ATRAFCPRSQATITPSKMPAGAGLRHSGSLYGASAAITTGSGPAPPVTEVPTNSTVSPLSAVRVRVLRNARFCVEAATVVTHGETWLTVAAPGPSLPAEAATNTPAAYASRNASSTGSVNGLLPPEMEKWMTSTPSSTAWATACAMSEGKQPSGPHTRYMITPAPGATPGTGPWSAPSTGADASTLPAAVPAVWVPWPLSSRAVPGNCSSPTWSW